MSLKSGLGAWSDNFGLRNYFSNWFCNYLAVFYIIQELNLRSSRVTQAPAHTVTQTYELTLLTLNENKIYCIYVAETDYVRIVFVKFVD